VDYNVLCRVGDSLEYLGGVVLLDKSAGGADYGTLTAAYTAYVCEILVEGAADGCIEASVVSADNAYILLLTSGNAAAAEDTFIVVAHEVKCRDVLVIVGLFTGKLLLVYTVLEAQGLQLAII
jgi:hypothetical protein